MRSLLCGPSFLLTFPPSASRCGNEWRGNGGGREWEEEDGEGHVNGYTVVTRAVEREARSGGNEDGAL